MHKHASCSNGNIESNGVRVDPEYAGPIVTSGTHAFGSLEVLN
jgi:hypothetical protein